nr:MAG TPA: hypothetical protein [Caudoviricetes sp.]
MSASRSCPPAASSTSRLPGPLPLRNPSRTMTPRTGTSWTTSPSSPCTRSLHRR